MPASTYHLHRINSLDDPWLLPWLELYETAFPANERLLVANILRQIQRCSQGIEDGSYLLAWIGDNQEFAGMAHYTTELQKEIGLLWYIAINPSRRSQGLGSILYQALIQELIDHGCRVVLFEVETPGEAHTPEQKLLAERRIRFYQRQGAFLLNGISYLQYVGSHLPPTPMHLMVHLLKPVNAQQAFDLACLYFGASLQKTGVLSLE
jgi:ribosomal protein S18 acetylase RimI-like enzyme